MWTFWMIFGFCFLMFLAFQAGRSADAARERGLRRRTADEVRRLADERRWLAEERQRYREAARRWKETRDQRELTGRDATPVLEAGRSGLIDTTDDSPGASTDDDEPPGGTALPAYAHEPSSR
jgi:hypothetical protein